jgi:branched-chain amino acid transport system permease protein
MTEVAVEVTMTTGTRGVRRPRRGVALGPVAATTAGVLLLAYPFVFRSTGALNIGILALVYAIAASGWNVLGGYTGQVSFGHAMFFGCGGYTTALLVRAGAPPWPSIAVGAACAGALSVLVGLPAFRLRSHYYSIGTIAFAQIAEILVNQTHWLGRSEGLSIPLTHNSLWTLQFSLRNKTPYYLVALALFGICTLGVWLFLRGRAGVYVRCIRDDEIAASAIGIPVRRYKLLAAGVSGTITGVAGGYFAMYVLFVDPDSVLGLSISITIALTAVAGGAGRLAGPVVGAWVLTTIQQYSRIHFSGSGRSTDLLLYGALIIVIAVVEPGGITAAASRLARASFVHGAVRRLPFRRQA